MQIKFPMIFVSVLLLFVFWTPSSRAQSEELRRPTRPDSFNSPEEVAKYVQQLQDYFRAKSVRFGKRLAPISSNLQQKAEDLETADEINEMNKQILEHDREKAFPSKNYMQLIQDEDDEEEKNPQEQLARRQMMRALSPRVYAHVPLPLLLAKYIHPRRQPQLVPIMNF